MFASAFSASQLEPRADRREEKDPVMKSVSFIFAIAGAATLAPIADAGFMGFVAFTRTSGARMAQAPRQRVRRSTAL